jgi:hypothetical protein
VEAIDFTKKRPPRGASTGLDADIAEIGPNRRPSRRDVETEA